MLLFGWSWNMFHSLDLFSRSKSIYLITKWLLLIWISGCQETSPISKQFSSVFPTDVSICLFEIIMVTLYDNINANDRLSDNGCILLYLPRRQLHFLSENFNMELKQTFYYLNTVNISNSQAHKIFNSPPLRRSFYSYHD